MAFQTTYKNTGSPSLDWDMTVQNLRSVGGYSYKPAGSAGTLYDPNRLNDKVGKDQPQIQYVSIGPNYKALAAATKAGAERQKDLLQQNWQTSFNAPKANLDFQTQEAEAAKDLAYQDYLTSVSNSKRLNDSAWFIGEQKLNNLNSLINNSMNNQYGSIRDVANKLQAKNRDIRDQSLYADYNSNILDAEVERIGKYNTINQSLDEAKHNTWQQYQDLLNQARSNQADYANNLLAELASYYDTSVVNKEGKITNWDWLNQQSGITNDGNNNYALDLQWFLGNMMTPDEFNEYLTGIQNNHTPLLSIPQLNFHRTIQETTNKVRGQADRNRSEAQKASHQAANQSYSTQQQQRGY